MKINEDNRLCNLIAKCLAYGRKVGIVSDDDNIACLDLLMRKDTSWSPSEDFLDTLESEKPNGLDKNAPRYPLSVVADLLASTPQPPVILQEESEKPMNLEEEIKKEMVKLPFFIRGKDQIAFARHFFELGCRRTAEMYDDIEYNRQRAEEEIPNDLEEAAEKEYPCDKSCMTPDMLDLNAHKQVAFRKGAKWQKEQDDKELSDLLAIAHLQGADQMKELILKDAVEGRIEEVSFNNGELHNTIFFSFDEESLHVENRIWFPRCGKDGDKVRIIIVKED